MWGGWFDWHQVTAETGPAVVTVMPEETKARRPKVYCPKVYYRVESTESSLRGAARSPPTSQPANEREGGE